METINIVQVTLEVWGALFCGICGCITVLDGNKTKPRGKILTAVLFINMFILIFDSLAYIYRGVDTTMGFWMTRISNFMVFILEYGLLSVAAEYFYLVITDKGGEKNHGWVTAVHILCATGMGMVVISQFTDLYYAFDETNHYYRNPGWYYGMVVMYACFVICAYEIILNRKLFNVRQKRAMYSYILLPTVASVIQMFYYGLSLINISITVALLILYLTYAVQQIHDYANLKVGYSEQKAEAEKQRAEVERQKHEVVNSQMNLLLGQMQPHFVYNSLATIRSLCMEDPELAVETIDHFTGYLRSSLNIMDGTKLVAFETEMELIDDYLYMEKQRFGDKIQIHKKIETMDFRVPPLAIQTLVENAIRHGIRGKNEPGNLWIKTDHKNGKTYLIIEDDGVGFDTTATINDGEHHIGMASTRKRIQALQHGSFEIRSELGRGTKIVIILPDNLEEEV